MKKGRAKPISDLLKAKDLLNVRYVYGHDGASREGRCILSLIGSCRRAKSMSMLDKTCDVLYIDCDTSFKYVSSFIVYICSFSSNGIYIICSIMLQIGVEPSRGMPTRIL